ncbi:MAG: hypothetical protein HKM24_05205 [Gammaproteobacteria bacterium]|nr:hypothetical protein [Gammaproteobacteria bacterium]
MSDHLQTILADEKITADDSSLLAIAEAADGSMRDALSLTDQAIVTGGGKLSEADVRAMLGTVDRSQIEALLTALSKGDATALVAVTEKLDEFAPDYAQVLDEIAELLQRAAMVQALSQAGKAKAKDALVEFVANNLSPEDVQLYYQVAVMGRRDLYWAPNPRCGFEMTMLRMMAFEPGSSVAISTPSATVTPISASQSKKAVKKTAPAKKSVTSKPVETTKFETVTADNWSQVVEALPLAGMSKQLARHCLLMNFANQCVALQLEEVNEHLLTDNGRSQIADALSKVLNSDVKVIIELGKKASAVASKNAAATAATPAQQLDAKQQKQQQALAESMSNDPTVQAFAKVFDAKIKPDSLKPSGSS